MNDLASERTLLHWTAFAVLFGFGFQDAQLWMAHADTVTVCSLPLAPT